MLDDKSKTCVFHFYLDLLFDVMNMKCNNLPTSQVRLKPIMEKCDTGKNGRPRKFTTKTKSKANNTNLQAFTASLNCQRTT